MAKDRLRNVVSSFENATVGVEVDAISPSSLLLVESAWYASRRP